MEFVPAHAQHALPLSLDQATPWGEMPQDQGQIVAYSYAVIWPDELLVRRCFDRSDLSVRYCAADLDPDGDWTFEPQNGRLPDHGDWRDVTCED